jgi:hypothetical protein
MALGTKIQLPPLKDFMFQEYDAFLENPKLNYGCGLLITTYFFHIDGAGDAKRIKAFLQKLHDKNDGRNKEAQLIFCWTGAPLNNSKPKSFEAGAEKASTSSLKNSQGPASFEKPIAADC